MRIYTTVPHDPCHFNSNKIQKHLSYSRFTSPKQEERQVEVNHKRTGSKKNRGTASSVCVCVYVCVCVLERSRSPSLPAIFHPAVPQVNSTLIQMCRPQLVNLPESGNTTQLEISAERITAVSACTATTEPSRLSGLGTQKRVDHSDLSKYVLLNTSLWAQWIPVNAQI